MSQIKRSFIPVASIIICLLLSCGEKKKTDTYFLSDHLDTTVSPGDNFFQYATGNWLKKNPIPDDESEWGIGNVVSEEIYNRIRKINEDAVAKKLTDGSMRQKIADFWFSGMDSSNIEEKGITPLKPDFDNISAIKSVEDIIKVSADLHTKGISVLFRDVVGQDDKNSSKMIYWLWQGGLLLPDRDYYFNSDKKTLEIQQAYLNYLVKTLKRLLGSAAAETNAKSVYDLEKRMAAKSRKLEDLRDPERNYHKMGIGELSKTTPGINWSAYAKNTGISTLDSVIVGQPEFYSNLSEELTKTPLEIWKNYLRVQVMHAMAPYLDSATYNEYFEYRNKLFGVTKQRPRWKRVLGAQEKAMGEGIGQLFVQDYFKEKTKTRYVNLVKAVLNAFKDRIRQLDWMSDSTKQKALTKLALMKYKVGYPDKWKDFNALKIGRESYVLNIQYANKWWYQYEINKLNKPVDKSEWKMVPQAFDAYYSFSNNEIVLPAAIFTVPGMKDEDLDDAFVYGYVAAATIGHEVTHGFDDQGRQYDAIGNLSGWWTHTDSVEFAKRARKIIAQFNEFNPVDSLYINGNATQGENIADLGGMLLGLDAYKKTEEYKKGGKIGNLTGLQRYFLGYSFGWSVQLRKELLRTLLMTDVHSPPLERVNGPVVNVPEFYVAFDIKKDDKMYREDSLRVKIW